MDDPQHRVADVAPFTMVPNWILPTCGKNAMLVYYALGTFPYSRKQGVWPSVPEIATRAGVSEMTVRRALLVLVKHGAITIIKNRVDERGSPIPNLYDLRPGRIRDDPTLVSDLDHPGTTVIPPGLMVAPELYVREEVEKSEASASEQGSLEIPSPSKSTSTTTAVETPLVRARDPIWDAFVEMLGREPATKSERGAWNRAAKELREIDTDRLEILVRARRYREHWPGVDLTPTALARHWGAFAAARGLGTNFDAAVIAAEEQKQRLRARAEALPPRMS